MSDLVVSSWQLAVGTKQYANTGGGGVLSPVASRQSPVWMLLFGICLIFGAWYLSLKLQRSF